jgi:YggT family protein
MSFLAEIAQFIIVSLLDFYLMILALRILLHFYRFDYYHPVAQIVLKLTDPVVRPLKNIIPLKSKIEIASVIVLLTLTFLKFFLFFILSHAKIPNLIGLMIMSLGDCLKLFVWIILIAIIIQSILSWVAPHKHNPLITLLYKITEPTLKPVRKYIPPISGLDISPLFVLLILSLLIKIGDKIVSQGQALLF